MNMKKLSQARYYFLGLWLALMAFWVVQSANAPAHAKSRADHQTPAYSRLFDQALALDARGDWQAALRVLSRVYGAEVPVQAFYDTLDRHKLRILAGLSGSTVFLTDRQAYTLDELKHYFTEVFLPRPDVLRHDLNLSAELPLARFLYLYAVMGRDQPKTGNNPLLKPAVPGVDVTKALASLDPWLVSAALFLARKGQDGIEPRAVIARWESRPDLWDEVCTEQALLLFAGQTPLELKDLQKDDFVSMQMGQLKPLRAKTTPRLQTLCYWRGTPMLVRKDYLKPAECSGLSAKRFLGFDGDKPNGKRSGQSDQKNFILVGSRNCHDGFIKLPAGTYVLDYRATQAHGKSRPFELKPKTMVRLVVTVWGEI